MVTKYLAIALIITAFSGCNSPSASPKANRSFSPAIQKDLLHLHQLQSYRAGKNSFVLGLETICNRPAMLAEHGRKTILSLEGKGSLRHIWETHGPGKSPFILEFFVDGEQQPSIQGPLDDDSMNGIKLVQKAESEGNQMQLHYKTQIEEIAPPEIKLPEATTERWQFKGDFTVRVEGPAIIRRLALNAKREGVTMLIRFDGEDSPAVNVDLADFYGPFRGVTLNNNQCYFPMPSIRGWIAAWDTCRSRSYQPEAGDIG